MWLFIMKIFVLSYNSTSMYVDHASSVRWALVYAYYGDTLMHQRCQLLMGSIKKKNPIISCVLKLWLCYANLFSKMTQIDNRITVGN